jgi:shikimate dehydrogenase
VTIPHKQKIIPYLDDLTPQALSTMAVNTLYWEENHLWGDNTDCQGFINSLTMRGITPSSALILGAGGATLACLQGLKQLGTQDIFVTSRRKETVSALKQTSPHPFQSISWDERADIEVDMLINATPVGMAGLLMDQSPFPAKGLKNITYCYDLIYNPPQTQLLQQAQQKGCTTINGLDMFILQAQAQFSLWTGHHFPNSKAKQLITDCLTHL